MNHLAHFHLAWPDAALLAGALEGDYCKGPLGAHVHPDLTAGITLHRSIDAYTDQHPRLAELRNAFPDRLRRYAGILLDLSFDYYLTRHWQEFAELPLPEFNDRVLSSLEAQPWLGSRSRRAADRFREYQVLLRYRDWDMVLASAARVGERLRRSNPLHDVATELAQLRPAIERGFLEFYPQLQRHATEWRANPGNRIVAADT